MGAIAETIKNAVQGVAQAVGGALTLDGSAVKQGLEKALSLDGQDGSAQSASGAGQDLLDQQLSQIDKLFASEGSDQDDDEGGDERQDDYQGGQRGFPMQPQMQAHNNVFGSMRA